MILPATKDLEIELKLELTPEGMAALIASPLWSEAPVTLNQDAIYFDTPAQALRRNGLFLRIRREGERRMQTVKASGTAAGLFMRPEWEREVRDDQPVLDNTIPVTAAIGDDAAAIAPIFTIENERRQWNVCGIEISLDCGKAIASGRETRFNEIELEQKNGDCAEMFALARKIDAIAPVHLGVMSKAEQGYRLLGPVPAAAKAQRIVLEENLNAAAALQAIGFACLRHYRLNVPLIIDNLDAAALHQARVAIRRLRSALSIQRRMFTDRRLPELNAELRWLAAELGKARDIDVVIQQGRWASAATQLQDARATAYRDVATTLQSDRARALIIDLVEWLTAGDWLFDARNEQARAICVRDAAAMTLKKLRRKVKKWGRNFEELDDESRHDLRKTAKKLRYAVDFFATLYSSKQDRRRLKRFTSSLEQLQDNLEDLNDLSATPEILQRVGIVAGAHQSNPTLKSHLLKHAQKHYAKLIRAKRFWC